MFIYEQVSFKTACIDSVVELKEQTIFHIVTLSKTNKQIKSNVCRQFDNTSNNRFDCSYVRHTNYN